MKKYTILLLYPDYFTGGDVETYLSWVIAKDSDRAVSAAQQDAYAAGNSKVTNLLDFVPLAVFEGHLSDLNPGAQRCIL